MSFRVRHEPRNLAPARQRMFEMSLHFGFGLGSISAGAGPKDFSVRASLEMTSRFQPSPKSHYPN